MTDEEKIVKTARKFPAVFGLRHHIGKFRISVPSSYVDSGQVVIYTEKLVDNHWLSFAKTTEYELEMEFVGIGE